MLTLIEKSRDILLADGTVYRKPAVSPPISVGREYNLAPPASVNRILHRKFGSNIFGEPRYRVIWGWQRMSWFGGEVDVYSDDGSTWLRSQVGVFCGPKYDYTGNLERWMLEKWVPAEDYGSPEDWAEQTEEVAGAYTLEGIGPYPSRGEYELSTRIEDRRDGSYLGLTEAIVSFLCETIERSREIHEAKRRQRLQEEQAKREESYRNLAGDIWDDARVAFNGVPNSTQANAPSPKPKGRILQFVN